MKAPEILQRAAQHMSDRAASREQPDGERSMRRTVDAFNALTGHRLTERDGWLFMAVLKAARACNTAAGMPDDYEDGAAYFALAGESAYWAPTPPAQIAADVVDLVAQLNAESADAPPVGFQLRTAEPAPVPAAAPAVEVDETLVADARSVYYGGRDFTVPAEYRYIAQDSGGAVYAYTHKPKRKEGYWLSDPDRADSYNRYLGHFAVFGDWRTSLRRLP